jgi:hypothetical protein
MYDIGVSRIKRASHMFYECFGWPGEYMQVHLRALLYRG